MQRIVLLNSKDNVVTSLAELSAGTEFDTDVDGSSTKITVRDAIPFAFKVAIKAIEPGDDVVKYGEVIGRASQTIQPGDLVHIHNVESARARGDIQ